MPLPTKSTKCQTQHFTTSSTTSYLTSSYFTYNRTFMCWNIYHGQSVHSILELHGGGYADETLYWLQRAWNSPCLHQQRKAWGLYRVRSVGVVLKLCWSSVGKGGRICILQLEVLKSGLHCHALVGWQVVSQKGDDHWDRDATWKGLGR